MKAGKGDAPPSDLKPRIVSALILVAIAALVTWLGGVVFAASMVALAAVLYFEWTRMTLLPTQAFSVLWGAGGLFLAGVAIVAFDLGVALWLAAGSAASLVLVVKSGIAPTASLTRTKWAIGGMAYALAATVSLIVIRAAETDGSDERGLLLLAFLFLVVWATDILAYFVGRSVGGPKLMPKVSPKKTISGALGGLAGAMLVGALLAPFLPEFGAATAVLLALVLSIVSQIGDLFESWIKRRYAVKDSSNLIPGHGGFMDRVDGLVFAAVPLALYIAATG